MPERGVAYLTVDPEIIDHEFLKRVEALSLLSDSGLQADSCKDRVMSTRDFLCDMTQFSLLIGVILGYDIGHLFTGSRLER
ncbi:MAG: hypothetical protein Ct9H300mP16_07490 [Pseudomonadota bacterium]|nr:MAG: hypothetical protein Ct9H300mP16_07490 [Pseudomonadota bacterium]